MNLDFEIFEAGPVATNRDRLHVTINKNGHIFSNRLMLEALGEPHAVMLMFDRRRKIIGVMPSQLYTPHSFPLKNKQSKKSRGRMVYANNFFRHYSIRPSETIAFVSPEVNNNGILVLNLHDVRSVKKV